MNDAASTGHLGEADRAAGLAVPLTPSNQFDQVADRAVGQPSPVLVRSDLDAEPALQLVDPGVCLDLRRATPLESI
jgi:hypothetical protein